MTSWPIVQGSEFGGGALLIASLIGLVVLANFFAQVPKTLLFWAGLVLTRPFGATMGDLLTKTHAQGGFGFGTIGSSLIPASILVALTAFASKRESEEQPEV